MGVGSEGEAVAGIVVAAFGVLVDVGGLDDVACSGLEAVAGEGAGVSIAGADFGLESVVAAFFAAGLVGFPVVGELRHLGGIGNRDAESFAKADLLGGSEVCGDHDPAGAEPEGGIEQAIEEVWIELAEACGELGNGGLAVFVEAFPDGVPFTAEGVERHGDFRTVFPALHHQIPVVPEAGDEIRVVSNPAIPDRSHFDQIHHAENHQRLVRGDAEGG